MKPIAASALLLLAGCGSGGPAGNGEAATGNAAVSTPAHTASATPLPFQPGEWETTTIFTSAASEQLPPSVVRACMTAAEAERMNAALAGGGSNDAAHVGATCDYGGISVSGGHMSGRSSCTRAGVTTSSTMDGSISPNGYDIVQQIEATIHGRAQRSTNHIVGRRIGDCPAGH